MNNKKQKEIFFTINFDNNIYLNSNKEYFYLLIQLIKTFPNGVINIIRKNKKYSDLKTWIESSLPLLQDDFYTLSTKCYWILNGLTDFPVCQLDSCNHKFDKNNKTQRTGNVSIFRGYGKFCSRRCQALDKNVQELKKKTKKQKYGDENYNNRAKALDTIYSTYGENAFNIFYQIGCNTKEIKYGTRGYVNSKLANQTKSNFSAEKKQEIIQKRIKTYHSKTGYDYPSQNPKNKVLNAKKSKKTCKEKFGVESYAQTQKWKDDQIKINQEKYGIDWYLQTDEFKQKSIDTCLEKYQTKYYLQSKDFRDRMSDPLVQQKRINRSFQTRKKNGTLNTSMSENTGLKLLQQKFGINDVEYSYKSKLYPFHCDYYIKSLDLYIELNEHWTHGNHIFDPSSEEDIAKVKQWKEKNKKYYDNAIYVWTDLDQRKIQIALKNNLNYKIFWKLSELENWCKTKV